MTDRSETAERKTNPPGHETADLDGGRVALWAVALGGIIFGALVVTAGLWRWLRDSGPADEESIRRLTAEAGEMPPARIVLDPHQRVTRLEYERQQAVLLTEYAWVDRQQGIARIPIERAMQIVADRASEQP